jgi:hypothetical protein
VLERQAPGHVTTLMQDTLSDIISLQFNKHSDWSMNTFNNWSGRHSSCVHSADISTGYEPGQLYSALTGAPQEALYVAAALHPH